MRKQKIKKFVLWYQLLERVLAIALHLLSRSIIGICLFTGRNIALIIIVFLVFALVDGWGGYIARKWDLEDVSYKEKFIYCFCCR